MFKSIDGSITNQPIRVQTKDEYALKETGSRTSGGHAPTWYFRILPFIEQEPLWSQFVTAWGTTKWYDAFPNMDTATVQKTPIAIFRCPSFPLGNLLLGSDPPNQYNRQYGCYVVNLGPTNYSQQDYAAHFPADQGWWRPAGQPFALDGLDISFASVADGLSNTLFMTEITPPLANLGATSYGDIQLLWGGGITTQLMPNNIAAPDSLSLLWDPGTVGRDGKATASSCSWAVASVAARSFHSGGVNVGLGDGSIRFVPDTVSAQTWGCMGNGGDGLAVSLP